MGVCARGAPTLPQQSRLNDLPLIRFTQTGLSVPLGYHQGPVGAARTVLDVKVPEEQPQRPSLCHAQLPLAPDVAGVGPGVVLRGQRAGLYAQRCMSTPIT